MPPAALVFFYQTLHRQYSAAIAGSFYFVISANGTVLLLKYLSAIGRMQLYRIRLWYKLLNHRYQESYVGTMQASQRNIMITK